MFGIFKVFIKSRWFLLLYKLAFYLGIIYLSVVGLLLATFFYFFFNFSNYKLQIENLFNNQLQYQLKLGSINSRFNSAYNPEISISSLELTSLNHSQQKIVAHDLNLIISYTSFFTFYPVFKQIKIATNSLKFTQAKDSAWFLNGILLTPHQPKTLANVKTSFFDIEQFILNQKEIILIGDNLSFQSLKYDLNVLNLHQAKVILNRFKFNSRHLNIDVLGENIKDHLNLNLFWVGNKLEDWQSWQKVKLLIKAYTQAKNHQAVNNQPVMTTPDSNTAVNLYMNQGKIINLTANFDINDLKLALNKESLSHSQKIGGKLEVKLKGDYYKIRAEDLTLLTSAGYLFKDAEINGYYLSGRQGQVELSNTNLIALNNFLKLFPQTHSLKLSGTLSDIQLTWQGAFLKPNSYQLSGVFNELGVISNNDSYPSLNNISGKVKLTESGGFLDLNLNNSKLDYPAIFLRSYRFKTLTSTISWQSGKVFNLQVESTNFDLNDFKGNLSGSYRYNSESLNDLGYLKLNALIDKVKTSLVGDYLPKEIPVEVHQWLNMALVSGFGENAKLVFDGPLDSFPYANHQGLFYITAKINDAKLRYDKDWPTLDSISGKFILKNTAITIKADSGLVKNNRFESTIVIIPNYDSESGVYLTVDGYSSGKTSNFLSFIESSPLNDIIGKLPEKLVAKGDSTLKLKLKVPFDDPKASQVNGKLKFLDNQLVFNLPIPELNKVNGVLEFNESGLLINQLALQALNSDAILSATTSQAGNMNFKVSLAGLNYNSVALYYLPFLSGFIQGNSPTKFEFNIDKTGFKDLTANSLLKNVAINAPAPLRKEPTTSEPLNLKLTPSAKHNLTLNWQLGANLRGKQVFTPNNDNYGFIALGGESINYLPALDSSTKLTVNGVLSKVVIESWLSFANNIQKNLKLNAQNNQQVQQKALFHDDFKPEAGYKVQIAVNTQEFLLNKTSFAKGSANIIIDADKSFFNFYTPVLVGSGVFNYSADLLNLHLERYMLFKKEELNYATTKLNAKELQLNSSPPVTAAKLPKMNIVVDNLFYQNHNLGKLSLKVFQKENDLYLESGVLTAPFMTVHFAGVNTGYSQANFLPYVDLKANLEVTNLGDLIYALDYGRLVGSGRGEIEVAMQWNGGLNDFGFKKSVGSINASLKSGKFLEVNPGLLGGLMSIINLQGLFEFTSGSIGDIFKRGFYFNNLLINSQLAKEQINLSKIKMEGPLATVNSKGGVNLSNNTVDATVSVTPELSIAVAVTAGVATLNPLIGVAVYLGEKLLDNPQDKAFTFSYKVSGNLEKPKVEKVGIKEQSIKNAKQVAGAS